MFTTFHPLTCKRQVVGGTITCNYKASIFPAADAPYNDPTVIEKRSGDCPWR